MSNESVTDVEANFNFIRTDEEAISILESKIESKQLEKIRKINNSTLNKFIAKYIKLCNPSKIFVSTDSEDDIDYIRKAAIKYGEEEELSTKGQTVHFDGYYDQARDKKQTKFLVSKDSNIPSELNTIDRTKGLKEMHEYLENIMDKKELFILFFCLGPKNSEFTLPCVQLTDSAYVAHNENLLYRHGYDEFLRRGDRKDFFQFVHSAGELDERNVSKNIDKRRIFIDLDNKKIYSVNTQYGGNTIGLKKLAMRLAIAKSSKEGWLTEHMFVMGIHGPKDRITYFTGAFPSLCGKTSTAMMEGESIVGDDIAYLRKKNGEVRAVNVEKGIFGIVKGINSKDDPAIWNALHRAGEVIFSNVLATEENHVHWIGKDGELPEKGKNYSGEWWIGKKDDKGEHITCSHPNARFTIDLHTLDNADPKMDDPNGVKIDAIVYGGRDSDTWVPVEEAFNWEHGIITKGASLESETTAATLGSEGIRKINPMSNLDFLSIPISEYINNNLDFGKDLKKTPHIFSVNYFIRGKESSKLLTSISAKRVWYKWMERRAHNEVDAIETPTGKIPKYEDLKALFKEVLNEDYKKEDYEEQFTLRVPENLEKIERIKKYYKKQNSQDLSRLFNTLDEQKKRLIRAQEKFGDYISPKNFLKH